MPEEPIPGVDSSSCIMSERSHFWLRVIGLAVILAVEFGPRLWSAALSPSPTPAGAVAETR
jgi:hypothetical protein